ncbi:dipeptide ABC transporter ATP-binding protein [Hamadaea tsunoensis]|uniref:dipeptide ABC transporter ATP-binding protein n=1 Tax=Hamadaea tsunoensis TaxID=53368 RepID=UPI00040A793B|nr:ABC transporter ATP-binding protein [Hamadaea tsunoensis]
MTGDDDLLTVTDLRISFDVDGRAVEAVRGVTFGLRRGRVLALVGESGSGKSATALAALGLLPATATVAGSIRLGDQELVGADRRLLRTVRGGRIGTVFQEPMSALNPMFTVGDQIAEAVAAHRPAGRDALRRRVRDLLELVGLPDPERIARAYPHELSGGQLQRAVIAMAVSCDPEVLIADEPTTALDVTVQAGILDLLRELRAKLGTAILLITHDMGVVADLADDVVVLRDGRVVEQAPAEQLFARPGEDYTRLLLSSVPGRTSSPRAVPAAGPPLVRLDHVTIDYRGRQGRRVRAVDGVSLDLRAGEIVGLVGESGSGKSTLGRAIAGLVPVTGGALEVAGTDVAAARGHARRLRAVRARLGIVFQDPASSLNPRRSIAGCVAEPLLLHSHLRGAALDSRVDDLLDAVQLSPSLHERYPHELSGGQRQRVAIARAIALDPALLIADEPTSALDVSVQARILELLAGLQRDLGFACLFVSHDLAVIEQLADRIAVLHEGRLVEEGPADAVLGSPREAYTRRLLAAAPVADPAEQRRRREARAALTAIP